MSDIDLHTQRFIGWVRSNIEAMGREAAAGGLDLSTIWAFRRVVTEASENVSAYLREMAPALHLAFDDAGGTASYIVTPGVNIRIGDEVQKITWLTKDDLEIPEIRRGLGRPLATLLDCSFEMSRLVQDAGQKGVTFICELEDDDIHMLAAPYDAKVPTEEPMSL
ncbi:hypothetical protein ACGYLO_11385 [Sulfitobacter sp. 1A13353]|uniref:hypothetical protein n=1 Tax=Sulfitobacter sp. 1A13353 TaxID=3368568 RepID=UPI003746D67B